MVKRTRLDIAAHLSLVSFLGLCRGVQTKGCFSADGEAGWRELRGANDNLMTNRNRTRGNRRIGDSLKIHRSTPCIVGERSSGCSCRIEREHAVHDRDPAVPPVGRRPDDVVYDGRADSRPHRRRRGGGAGSHHSRTTARRMTTRGRINSRAVEEGILETTRESYQQKMEAQLKEWSSRLEALQAKVEKAGAEHKKELLAELEELKKLQARGREHFSSVATQTWDEVKTELTEKWNQVSGAVDAIWA